ncbi:MAG: hypothetical protein M2R45_03401 [Verrucomicrobia subdivision 3 bacterium]|nr:hypothetical protein [Limisphaerales bacterium]MCS1416306.1 hypothetical protein [Limisphaerales bacterium]
MPCESLGPRGLPWAGGMRAQRCQPPARLVRLRLKGRETGPNLKIEPEVGLAFSALDEPPLPLERACRQPCFSMASVWPPQWPSSGLGV